MKANHNVDIAQNIRNLVVSKIVEKKNESKSQLIKLIDLQANRCVKDR